MKYSPGGKYFLTYFEEQSKTYSQYKKKLNRLKVLVEKSIYFAVFLIVMVEMHKLQCRIKFVEQTDGN